jgi:multidrug efflux pump subunit AcrB
MKTWRTLFYDNRHLLGLFIAVSMISGAAALSSLPRLEDPRITTRHAIVVTPFPGASAERVEALVTEKLEDALLEVEEIKQIDSTSRSGVSTLSIELLDRVTEAGNDEIFSRIRDKIDEAVPELPDEALDPLFDDDRGAVAYTLITALAWPDVTADPSMGVLTRHAEALADRLRNLSGTERVRQFGQPHEQITVTLDPDRADHLGIDSSAVARALIGTDTRIPGGVRRDGQSQLIVEVDGDLDGLDRIREVIVRIADDGQALRVGDIAEVERGWRSPPDQIAISQGRRVIYVAARMGAGERADRWAEKARGIVADYRTGEGAGLDVWTVFDQSVYTQERLAMLAQNLLLGALIVMLVVLFSMGWRAAIAVGAALPLVAALSLLGVLLSGGALHQMSIFGMIIALGLLIDNAIVMTDEVRKRREAGDGPRTALGGALGHLFVPLLASTTTTVLGFLPILLLPGNAGDFVGWIGGSVVLALAFSFLVSVTVVGALAAMLVDPEGGGGWLRRGLRIEALTNGIRGLLRAAFRRPLLGMLAATSPALVGFALSTQLGSEFFPPVDRNMFDIKVWLSRTATVEESRRAAESLEETIRGHAEVEAVHWLAGNSFPSVYYNLVMNRDDVPFYLQGSIRTETAAEVDRLVPELQAELDAAHPDLQIVLSKFGQGPPSDAAIEYQIQGPDIARLQELGERIRRVLQQHEQVLHTRMTMPRGEPKLVFQPEKAKVRLAGLSLRNMATRLQAATEGIEAGRVIEGLADLPVRVRRPDAARADLGAIESMNLAVSGRRAAVPIGSLGRFALEPELGAITRLNGVRTNTIEGFPREGALPIDITREVLERLDTEGFSLPPGYRLTIAGDAEQSDEATGNLTLYAPLIGTLMMATLILVFRSVRVFAILVAVGGLSAGLGLAATWVIDFPISFNTILGTLGLVGVAFNNSIVVLAALRANPDARAGDPEALAEEVLGTSRHLLSTTLTTIGGFLPLLLLTGGNFWPSLAIVLAGGVAGAMILAMFFTPASYRLLHSKGGVA